MKRSVITMFWLVLFFPHGPGSSMAQSSAGYTLEENALNAGGGSASSAGYIISTGSLGDGVTGSTLSSASYALDGGFTPAYKPPGEVAGLHFLDLTNLEWEPDSSATSYNLYRGEMNSLSGLSYGTCSQQNLAAPTAADPDTPSAGTGYFYLATAVNRLAEEGAKGAGSQGVARQGMSCP